MCAPAKIRTTLDGKQAHKSQPPLLRFRRHRIRPYFDNIAGRRRSVDLHARKYAADEDVCGVEADGAREAEERVRNNEHVAEVHDHWYYLGDVELGVEIK